MKQKSLIEMSDNFILKHQLYDLLISGLQGVGVNQQTIPLLQYRLILD